MEKFYTDPMQSFEKIVTLGKFEEKIFSRFLEN